MKIYLMTSGRNVEDYEEDIKKGKTRERKESYKRRKRNSKTKQTKE